jgi:hypothetical protein
VPIAILFGDHKQLPPVLHVSLATVDAAGKAPTNPEKRLVQTFGALAYRSLDRFFVLDQPVRQASGPLLDALTHLRNGEYHASDLVESSTSVFARRGEGRVLNG